MTMNPDVSQFRPDCDRAGYYQRTCTVCGKAFVAARPQTLYGSPRCKRAVLLRRRHEAGCGACPGAVEACQRAWAKFRAGSPTLAHGPRGRDEATRTPSGVTGRPTGQRGASGRPANRYFQAGGLGGGHAEQSDGSFLWFSSQRVGEVER